MEIGLRFRWAGNPTGKDGRKHVAQRGEVGSEHAKLIFGQAVSKPAGERGKNIETGTVGHGRPILFR